MKTEILHLVKNSTTVRAEYNLTEKALPLAMTGLGLLAPGVAVRVAERLFMTPPRFEAPASEREFLAKAHSFRIPDRNRELAAWSWGDGPTVFLMHGWGGRGGQLQAFVQPLVEAGYSVVLFDAGGHGQSPGSQSSAVDLARSLFAAVLSAGPAHAVIAHSLGAVATSYAIRKGLAVNHAVFIGAPADPDAYLRSFSKKIGLNDTLRDYLKSRLERRLTVKWEELSIAETVRTSPTRLLLIHDLVDGDVSSKASEQIAAARPDIELLLTQGLGHRKILRNEAVIARVVDFLKPCPE